MRGNRKTLRAAGWLPLLLAQWLCAVEARSELLYRWRVVDYEFPNATVRGEYASSGQFVPEANLPLALEMVGERVFVTVPRWKHGVVSTLNYVWLNDTSESPVLVPYPSWEATRPDDPAGLVSILRVRRDECNRLWGVDVGTRDAYGTPRTVKPFTLVAIDLNTNQIVRQYRLKPTDVRQESMFSNLVVDSHPSACNDAYVYMADFVSNAMVVYSYARNDSWRVFHHFFSFDPMEGNYNVSGYDFRLIDGLFGMALSKHRPDGYRTLLFHPLSSTRQFAVSTRVLKNQTEAVNPNYYSFHYLGNKGPRTNGPTVSLDLVTDVAYFPLVLQNGVACWDTHEQLNPQTFRLVWHDRVAMDFPTDALIHRGQLCVLANRLPVFLYGAYRPNEFNCYVTCRSLEELTDLCSVSDWPAANEWWLRR